MTEITAEQIADIALFYRLDRADRWVLATWFDKQKVTLGRKFTHQGAIGYAFALIVSGSADVVVDGEMVRTLVAGDFFGELSMPRDARQTTVVVTTPSEIWTMFGTRFRELQAEYPDIAAVVEQVAQGHAYGQLPG